MSATLTVKREGHIMENRRKPFEVTVDGTSVGSVDRHETFEAPVEAGKHTLRVREGRYSSRSESFVVADGDAVTFRCYGGRIWPIFLASLVVPSLALTLEPE